MVRIGARLIKVPNSDKKMNLVRLYSNFLGFLLTITIFCYKIRHFSNSIVKGYLKWSALEHVVNRSPDSDHFFKGGGVHP